MPTLYVYKTGDAEDEAIVHPLGSYDAFIEVLSLLDVKGGPLMPLLNTGWGEEGAELDWEQCSTLATHCELAAAQLDGPARKHMKAWAASLRSVTPTGRALIG